jgi:hypothetical protein
MIGWSQTMTLTWVTPYRLTEVQPGESDTVRVQVNVGHDGQDVFSMQWIIARRTEQ